MKKKQIIEAILSYHPRINNYDGCDGYKSGYEEEECTGIVLSLVPTMEVIKKTIAMGANLLIVHEPISYQTPDYPDWKGRFINSVFEEKKKFIDSHHLTIWRDHDHMHAHQPDSIFSGVMKYLDWEQFYNREISSAASYLYVFDIPECTVEELGRSLIKKIGMNGLRYVGNPHDRIGRVAIVAHLYPDSFMKDEIKADGFYHSYDMELMEAMENYDIDAIIPGEIIEWTILSYIRDASYLGKRKACFNTGHFNMEELGMKYAADWVDELVRHRIGVYYLPAGDAWRYVQE